MKKLVLVAIVITVIGWWFKNPTVEAGHANVVFDYVVKYSGAADASARLPMLVALHGNGDTPSHFYDTALNQLQTPARIILLQAPIRMGRGSAWPMRSTEMKQYASAVAEVMPLLQARYPTQKQAALLGFSGGAVMAYYLGATHPEQFSYIFPISGKLAQHELTGVAAKHSNSLAIFAFHGIQDAVLNINGGRAAYRLLQERGANIHFHEFQGGHLGVFTNMKTEISRLIDEKLKALLYGA